MSKPKTTSQLIRGTRRERIAWRIRSVRSVRSKADLPELLWPGLLCKLGAHTPPRWQVQKFNGGNTCWLCAHCRLIVRYDSEIRHRISVRYDPPVQ